MHATTQKNCTTTVLITMDDKNFEKMEDYIHGKLSALEQQRFEDEMAQDEVLRQEVALYRRLIDAVETESARQLLEQIHEENFAKETTVVPLQSRRAFFPLAIAASLALLVLAGWWLFTLQSTQAEGLYAAYFFPAVGLPTTLGYTEDPQFAEGMISYKLQEYAEARNYWKSLVEADPQNDTLNYYMGIAFLADEMPDQAVNHLQRVVQQDESAYQNDAKWYVALAYLLAEQEENAKTILNELAATESNYQEPSREILNDLN